MYGLPKSVCVVPVIPMSVDSVCELFGETIRNVYGCSCYFVVECYGCVSVGGGALLVFQMHYFDVWC